MARASICVVERRDFIIFIYSAFILAVFLFRATYKSDRSATSRLHTYRAMLLFFIRPVHLLFGRASTQQHERGSDIDKSNNNYKWRVVVKRK